MQTERMEERRKTFHEQQNEERQRKPEIESDKYANDSGASFEAKGSAEDHVPQDFRKLWIRAKLVRAESEEM